MPFRSRSRSFRRQSSPGQWVTSADWGVKLTPAANTSSIGLIMGFPGGVQSGVAPPISRAKLARIQGRFHINLSGGAVGDTASVSCGIYVGEISTAGLAAGSTVWNPALASDNERNWVWHDTVLMMAGPGSSGSVLTFHLPSGMMLNRGRIRRTLVMGYGLFAVVRWVAFTGAPTTLNWMHTFRAFITRVG